MPPTLNVMRCPDEAPQETMHLCHPDEAMAHPQSFCGLVAATKTPLKTVRSSRTDLAESDQHQHSRHSALQLGISSAQGHMHGDRNAASNHSQLPQVRQRPRNTAVQFEDCSPSHASADQVNLLLTLDMFSAPFLAIFKVSIAEHCMNSFFRRCLCGAAWCGTKWEASQGLQASPNCWEVGQFEETGDECECGS
jgi:hypothetical protein